MNKLKWIGIPVAILIVLAILLVLANNVLGFPTTQEELDETNFGVNGEGTTIDYLLTSFTDGTVSTWSHTFHHHRLDNRETLISVIWQITITPQYSLIENANGVYRYQVSIDSVNVAGCTWDLQTFQGGGVAVTVSNYALFIPYCQATAGIYGNHTFTITRTTLSGTPATITEASTFVKISNVETVVLNMQTSFESLTNFTGIEFFLTMAVMFAAVYFWSRSGDFGIQFFMVIMLFIPSLIHLSLWLESNWFLGFGIAVIGILVGLYMFIRMTIDLITSSKPTR